MYLAAHESPYAPSDAPKYSPVTGSVRRDEKCYDQRLTSRDPQPRRSGAPHPAGAEPDEGPAAAASLAIGQR
jgi:hypothetical protein